MNVSFHPLIFIVGPTASGKSNLALALAKLFKGAIVNADSLQVYKRLDIGTAKPSEAERSLVDHFLFDIVPPQEVVTAGDYRKLALKVLNHELRFRPVFLVGGSGFYIQALEKGMYEAKKSTPESEEKYRLRLKQLTEELGEDGAFEHFYQELKERDPEEALRLNPRDIYRVTRALIVMDESGKKASWLRSSFKPTPLPFPLIKLGLRPSRADLLPRVQLRTQKMLECGLVDEVKALLRDGFALWPPLQAVGYKEVVDYLNAKILYEDLQELINVKTLGLAKKQRTWFQRDPEIHWLKFGPDQQIFDEAVEQLTLKGLKA